MTVITTGETNLATQLPLPPVPAQATPTISAAALAGDVGKARSALADAAKRIPALAADKIASLKLEVLVDQSRPDDREIADRVLRALDRLGIAGTITAVSAVQLHDRVEAGSCDLWIGQLAEPIIATNAWWGAAFAAGNDDWAQTRLATGSLDPAAAAKEFATRLPIVPLMFRAVLIWHRNDVRGLGFDATGRPDLANLYWFGKAKP
jgi:hypothetical protein